MVTVCRIASARHGMSQRRCTTAVRRTGAACSNGRTPTERSISGRCRWNLLKGDGADVRGELARLGLDLAPGYKPCNKLIEYITNPRPDDRARYVTRTGWHQYVFVLPDRTIGQASERVLFQSDTFQRHYAQAGTLADWQAHVAPYCVGNSRLLLAVSAAFAAMLPHPAGQESGGLNFVGPSSTGKTTALHVASSVYGGAGYLQRWRATANGLEALAALHNDALLVLDELAQVDHCRTCCRTSSISVAN